MPDKIAKFIESLDGKMRRRLKEKLVSLKLNPFRAKGVKKLKSSGGDFYRLRIGKIRIIYKISSKQVEVIDIDYRGNIY